MHFGKNHGAFSLLRNVQILSLIKSEVILLTSVDLNLTYISVSEGRI